jgi:tetratricopeptide (TPR) repeat protein/tRNA A-37 threonylcarbamoyl transferase component Bud32
MNPGNLLRNRYRIEKALAIGGFGETYLAIDLDYPGQRQVVVKQLKPAQSDPATLEIARRLFESEAQVLAELGETSDRLPALYAYFEEQGEFYLVQEFIPGQTLTMDLAGRQLSESQTIEILQEILAGLRLIHCKNKIHRDLKPDNIMRRTHDGKLVLIDFGAVKEVRQATNLGQNLSASIGIGTTGYMPTEQAIGFPRLASDVYAVGAIGIQCLTGVEPHKLFDKDALVLRWQHLCQVSSGLAAVLEKMVAQQVNGRYRDGMEAAEAIDKLSIAPSPSSTVIPNPVVTPAQVSASDWLDFGRHKFLKFLMVGGAGLFGMTLLVSVFSLVKIFFPETPITNNLSTDVASLSSSNTPKSTVNNGNNDTNNNRTLNASELESKEKEIVGYDKAIFLDPQDINAFINRGIAKYNLGNKQEAIADYSKAIAIDPKNAIAYYNRGLAKYDLGNKQEAIADYNKAISIDPKYSYAYNNRGLIKYDLGNKQEAIADYNKAIYFDPKDATAYYNRGLTKYDLGNKQEAIADYNKAISIDPKYAIAYYNRGLAKYDLGNKKEAIADYSKAIYINPKYAYAYNNRGLAKYDLGNKQEAIIDYNKAISFDPTNATAYYNRGLTKYDLGNKQEAIADYNKTLSFDPTNATAYYNRGLAKHDLDNKQEAIADYNKAISIDPKYAYAYNNRGLAKYDLGNKQEAIADYKQAAELYRQQGAMNDYQEVTELINTAMNN